MTISQGQDLLGCHNVLLWKPDCLYYSYFNPAVVFMDDREKRFRLVWMTIAGRPMGSDRRSIRNHNRYHLCNGSLANRIRYEHRITENFRKIIRGHDVRTVWTNTLHHQYSWSADSQTTLTSWQQCMEFGAVAVPNCSTWNGVIVQPAMWLCRVSFCTSRSHFDGNSVKQHIFLERTGASPCEIIYSGYTSIWQHIKQ